MSQKSKLKECKICGKKFYTFCDAEECVICFQPGKTIKKKMEVNKENTKKVLEYINNLEYNDLLKLQGIIENKVEMEQLYISLVKNTIN